MKLTTKVSQYILVVLLIHLFVLASIFFNVPILRQVMVFVYLTFFPGFLLLIALKVEKRDMLEIILLSVGLSIALVMFIGFMINMLYPILGISQPLSTIPLTLTMSGVTLVLFVVGLSGDTQRSLSLIGFPSIDLTSGFVQAIPLTFLPVLGIIGAIYRDFTVPLLIIAVALLFILSVLSTRLIPTNLYPFLIFMICLALALQFTLMSQHIMGNDAPLEYYVYHLTAIAGHWNPLVAVGQIEIYYSSMLSITVLPTVFSALLNVNGELLFKVLFPIVFCFVPLTLYNILSKQEWKVRTSLLATLFFISGPLVFYGAEPLSLNRQIIGEFFLILSIFLILETKFNSKNKTLLLTIFGAALAVSHYTLLFIYIGFLAFVLIVSKIKNKSHPAVNIRLFLITFIISLSWYLTYSTPLLPEIKDTFGNIISNVHSDLSNPLVVTASSNLFVGRPISNVASPINWGLFAAVHFLIVVGILIVTFRPKYVRIGFTYRVMIFFSGVILFATFVVPNFAPIINFSRFYALTMLFLAPCFVFGGEAILHLVKRVGIKITGRHNWHFKVNVTVLIAVLACSYFLSQSGFVNHVTGGSTLSFTLDWDKSLNLNMSTSFEPAAKVNFYIVYTPEEDVFSAEWLSANMANNSFIYSDSIANYHPLHIWGLIPVNILLDLANDTKVTGNSYIYLRTFNVENGFITPILSPAFYLSDINPELKNCNLLYTNGQSVVYGSPV